MNDPRKRKSGARTSAKAGATDAARRAAEENEARLDALFEQMDELLTTRLDPLMEEFKGTAFYDEYWAARGLTPPAGEA